MKRIPLLAALALFIPTLAQAALIEERYEGSPLQNIPYSYSGYSAIHPALTLDTTTGFRWLDVNLSRNYSYNTMKTMLADRNSAFFGFRIATQTEVLQLLTNHFTFTTFTSGTSQYTGGNYYTANAQPGTPEYARNVTNIGLYEEFYRKLGNNRDIGGLTTVGFYLQDNPAPTATSPLMLLNASYTEAVSPNTHSSMIFYNQTNSDYKANYTNIGTGWMLIQEPSAVPLGGSGILALCGLAFCFRRRR